MQPRSVSYDEFRQRVRRYPRSELLRSIAGLSVEVHFERRRPDPQNPAFPFVLAAIARTSLVSGNDHRSTSVSIVDIVDLCRMYFRIDDPSLRAFSGADRLRSMMSRLAYEQFSYQYSEMENVGRTIALLLDSRSDCKGAPTDVLWSTHLGVTLEQFMQIGFAIYAGALHNGGVLPRSLLSAANVAPIFHPMDSSEAIAVIDRWYSATVDDLRRRGQQEEDAAPGLEKFAWNPLAAYPAIQDESGYIVPVPRLMLDRFTPAGLYFIGLDRFGTSFLNALGCMFQHYVGKQLRLLPATIYDEVTYDRPEKKTVDFFLVTQEVVVLIEVKAARPVRATRLGQPAGDEDVLAKVGYAITQIDTTALLIDTGHSAVAHIPKDRPFRGLVVTLEPFHLTNTAVFRDFFPPCRVPCTIASAHELEGVAATASSIDFGRTLLSALTAQGIEPTSLRNAVNDAVKTPNPILAEAWERFSAPWEDYRRMSQPYPNRPC